MAEKEEKKEPDEEIVMVGENGELDNEGKEKVKPKEKVKTKEEESSDDSAEDDAEAEGEESEGDSERLGHSDTEGDEKRREQRRKERHETKRRRTEARDRNQRELSFLRQRNEQLERRFSAVESRTGQNEILAIDQRIGGIKNSIRTAEQVMADAVKKAAGDDLVEATRIRDELQDNLATLLNSKAQYEERAKQPEQRAPDPQLMAHAEDWRADHPWWTPGGRDDDSKIVAAIDEKLTREGGYDPTTAEYWEELSRRVKKRLPHRFESRSNGNGHDESDDDEEEETPKRGGKGPRFATGGRERPLKKNEVYVNPERKAALMELGAWDDPVLRKRYLKRYQEYDREHGSTRN